jgi:hypothetical protein
MAMACLRFEDRLDGASNSLSCKVRVTLLLKEYGLWETTEKVFSTPTDAAEKESLKKDIKAQESSWMP